jgi:hypothetical protein
MHNLGFLLPLWLLGAPLILALFDLMQTPKPSRATRDGPPTARP